MRRILFLGLILSLMSSNLFAGYDIFFENNTPFPLSIKTGTSSQLDEKYYGGWQSQTIQPYGREKVQWFNFNKGIKNGKEYTFFVEAKRQDKIDVPVITFQATIKGYIYGSTIQRVDVQTVSGIKTLFDSEPKPLFSKLRRFNVSNGLDSKQTLTISADAIKYSVPNPHKNIQLTDAFSYVLSLEQPQFQSQDDSNKLSILSYNIQIWPLYARAGGITLNKPAQRVINIAKKSRQYDVASFQEVFDRGHRNSLTHELADVMPYHAGPAFGNKPLSSGVVIYSRWPITDSKTYVYHDCDGIDCGAAKGVTYAKIEKHGQNYHIFSTHFQAGNSEGDKKARLKQMQAMRGFIEKQSIAQNEPVIINGDLNIDAIPCQDRQVCDEFNALLTNLNARYYVNDNHDVLPYTVDGYTNWMSNNSDPQVLDYIFVMKGHRQAKSYHSRILIPRGDSDPEMYTGTPYGDTDLSDHYAIEANMNF